MNPTSAPKLAPPGAGLPAVELFIGRLLFALSRWRSSRHKASARFQRERAAINALLRRCDAETGARRILIDRPRGLEDSSRYWSVWMTLDHLRIVHHQIARVIQSLTDGTVPDGTASTAAVKPGASATAAVLADYEKSCDALLATATNAFDLDTPLRYAHPWFGPLNAAGWHALAASHMRIHRLQIERILKGLISSTSEHGP